MPELNDLLLQCSECESVEFIIIQDKGPECAECHCQFTNLQIIYTDELIGEDPYKWQNLPEQKKH